MSIPDAQAPFDGVAAEYDADPHHALVAQHLVAGLAIPESVEVTVDVGCGTGAAAFAILARLAPERILAIDVSPGMLRVARRTAKQLDPDGRITWRLDEAIPLPVEDSSVDLAVCSSSLHFLGAAALPDWSRALRGDGQLAFSLPERTGFAPHAAFAAVVARDLELPATPDEASALARKAGFVDVEAHLLESHRDDRSRRTILVWAKRHVDHAVRLHRSARCGGRGPLRRRAGPLVYCWIARASEIGPQAYVRNEVFGLVHIDEGAVASWNGLPGRYISGTLLADRSVWRTVEGRAAPAMRAKPSRLKAWPRSAARG